MLAHHLPLFSAFITNRGHLDEVACAAVTEQILPQTLLVLSDQTICGVEHGLDRAIISIERDSVGALVTLRSTEHPADIGAAPAIDALVVVTHRHHAPRSEALEQAMLQPVRVLRPSTMTSRNPGACPPQRAPQSPRLTIENRPLRLRSSAARYSGKRALGELTGSVPGGDRNLRVEAALLHRLEQTARRHLIGAREQAHTRGCAGPRRHR